MENYKVYKHTFPNGKVYIGITGRKWIASQRWGNNGAGYIDQTYMRNAIKKYGWKNIKHEILFENMTKEEAEQKEIDLIKQYKSNIKGYGYNIQGGGNLLGNLSESGRNILSQKMIDKNPMKNKEIRDKISNALKGRKLTTIQKKKMSLNATNKRRIICITTNEIFNSIKEASKKFTIDYSTIVNICKGNRVSTKGLSFAYLDECNNFKIRENKVYRKIRCVETNEVFNSIKDATLLFKKVKSSNIYNALNGRCKTAYGYNWEYV